MLRIHGPTPGGGGPRLEQWGGVDHLLANRAIGVTAESQQTRNGLMSLCEIGCQGDTAARLSERL